MPRGVYLGTFDGVPVTGLFGLNLVGTLGGTEYLAWLRGRGTEPDWRPAPWGDLVVIPVRFTTRLGSPDAFRYAAYLATNPEVIEALTGTTVRVIPIPTPAVIVPPSHPPPPPPRVRIPLPVVGGVASTMPTPLSMYPAAMQPAIAAEMARQDMAARRPVRSFVAGMQDTGIIEASVLRAEAERLRQLARNQNFTTFIGDRPVLRTGTGQFVGPTNPPFVAPLAGQVPIEDVIQRANQIAWELEWEAAFLAGEPRDIPAAIRVAGKTATLTEARRTASILDSALLALRTVGEIRDTHLAPGEVNRMFGRIQLRVLFWGAKNWTLVALRNGLQVAEFAGPTLAAVDVANRVETIVSFNRLRLQQAQDEAFAAGQLFPHTAGLPRLDGEEVARYLAEMRGLAQPRDVATATAILQAEIDAINPVFPSSPIQTFAGASVNRARQLQRLIDEMRRSPWTFFRGNQEGTQEPLSALAQSAITGASQVSQTPTPPITQPPPPGSFGQTGDTAIGGEITRLIRATQAQPTEAAPGPGRVTNIQEIGGQSMAISGKYRARATSFGGGQWGCFWMESLISQGTGSSKQKTLAKKINQWVRQMQRMPNVATTGITQALADFISQTLLNPPDVDPPMPWD